MSLAVHGKVLGPIEGALERMLKEEQYAAAAERFAGKYAQFEFDPEQHRQELVRRVEEVLEGRREAAAVPRGAMFGVRAIAGWRSR